MNSVFLLLFSLSMLGGIVFAVLFIVGIFNKKMKLRPNKSAIILGILVVIFFVSAYGYDATMSDEQRQKVEEQQSEQEAKEKEEQKAKAKEEQKAKAKEEQKAEAKEEQEAKEKEEQEAKAKEEQEVKAKEEQKNPSIKYDIIQSIFISISGETTSEELENMIIQNTLAYTVQEYNGSNKEGKELLYKIAYNDEVAKQKYAESGDYLEVAFSTNNKDLKYAHYVNVNNTGCSALFYRYGTWYDFREAEINNAYEGYYFTDSFGDKTGIVIKYNNGNEVKTNYYQYNSAEDVLNKVINK